METRLRITYVGEYPANSKDYLTDDPAKMAEIDHKSLVGGEISLDDFLEASETIELKVEVAPTP